MARGEAAAPGAGIEERGHERQTERQGFQLIAADEPAFRIVARLVAHDARHGGAAIHVHRIVEHRVDAAGRMAHVVASDLAGAVGEPVAGIWPTALFSSRRGLSIELPATATTRAFCRCMLAVAVDIDDAGDLARQRRARSASPCVRPHFEIAGRLALGDFGVQRRPFGAGLAALEAEADLLACAARRRAAGC